LATEPPIDDLNEHSDIVPISIVDEMKTSYLDYAMSVIVSRALPDVRDGLKPVHRRILSGRLTKTAFSTTGDTTSRPASSVT